jgi:serine/threonine protein kinase
MLEQARSSCNSSVTLCRSPEDCLQAVAHLVSKCLSTDPCDRPTAAEVATKLLDMVKHEPSLALSDPSRGPALSDPSGSAAPVSSNS